VDKKSSPARSYSQVATNNPFNALSKNEEEDVEVEDLGTDINSDSSDAMPKIDNTQTAHSRDSVSKEGFNTALSMHLQRKLAQAARKNNEKTTGKHNFLLSQRSRDTLERVKTAKEALQQTDKPVTRSESHQYESKDSEKEQTNTNALDSVEHPHQDNSGNNADNSAGEATTTLAPENEERKEP
jgi:hypothetical protein